MGKLLIALVSCYQHAISPWLGPRCRFVPTCSQYAIAAIRKHGSVAGLCYTLWRLLRCQPFCKGGSDPVP